MFKGGYKLINLHNVNLKTGVGTTIKGVYDAIKSSHRKPLVLTGVVLGSVETNDIFVNVTIDNGNYKMTVPTGVIVVTKADLVTYTAS